MKKKMKNIKNIMKNIDLSWLLKGALIGFPIQLTGELISGEFNVRRLFTVTAQAAVSSCVTYNVTKVIIDKYENSDTITPDPIRGGEISMDELEKVCDKSNKDRFKEVV